MIGSGAVYIVDGTQVSYTSLGDRDRGGIVTLCGAIVHVLSEGDRYDLAARRPEPRMERPEEQQAAESKRA